MNKNVNELLQLIEKHPGVKVIPLVENHLITKSSYPFWSGSFGEVAIDHIINGSDHPHLVDNLIYYKSIGMDDVDADIGESIWSANKEIPDNELRKEIEKVKSTLQWETVITVKII